MKRAFIILYLIRAGPDASAAGVPSALIYLPEPCRTRRVSGGSTILPLRNVPITTVFFYIFRKYNITENPPYSVHRPRIRQPTSNSSTPQASASGQVKSATSSGRAQSLRKKRQVSGLAVNC